MQILIMNKIAKKQVHPLIKKKNYEVIIFNSYGKKKVLIINPY
jgi:hypothetical protein